MVTLVKVKLGHAPQVLHLIQGLRQLFRRPCRGQTVRHSYCRTHAPAVAGIVEKIWTVAEALWPLATVALASRG